MTAYQVNLAPSVTVRLGAVYCLPSGRYVRVLNQTRVDWYVETVCQREMVVLPNGTMNLTGHFIWAHGNLCWTADQWAGRMARVADELEALRQMRDRRVLAAEQDVARAKAIDAEYAAKKAAELAERKANRNIMRLAA